MVVRQRLYKINVKWFYETHIGYSGIDLLSKSGQRYLIDSYGLDSKKLESPTKKRTAL